MVGLCVLLQFNRLTIMIGIGSLVFVAVYPLMKRWTWWPQAFLGLTFNFGAIMGWTAVTGEISLSPLLLYISGFFWTIGYDTIYAMQDRDDDMIAGIKSTARLFTERWKTIKIPLYFVYGIHAVFMMGAICSTVDNLALWQVCPFILPFTHLIWQVKTLSTTDPKNSLERFRSNRDYALLVCVVIIIVKCL